MLDLSRFGNEQTLIYHALETKSFYVLNLKCIKLEVPYCVHGDEA